MNARFANHPGGLAKIVPLSIPGQTHEFAFLLLKSFGNYFYMYEYFLHVYMCTMYMPNALGGQQRLLDLLELDSGKSPCEYWETNLGSLQ